MTHAVTTIHPSAGVVPLVRFRLNDVETTRLLLRGSSVVDWVRLNFRSDEEIDAFIRINGFEPDDPADSARLSALQSKAVQYLQEHLRYKVPEVIKDSEHIRTLFRFASQTSGRRAYRFYACMTLKVIHIIHHVEAHELLSKIPLSDAEVAVLVHAKIERAVRGMIERKFPIVEFTGNSKTPYSVYSKLLAKKSTQAAAVLDKLRFRFVVERLEDIPALVLGLSRELLPFCYQVPNQTHNSLVDLHRMLVRAGNVLSYKSRSGEVQFNEPPVTDLVPDQKNEFSGPEYRILNFVVDIPVRVDGFLPDQQALFRQLGPVVFHGVEVQIVDRVTAEKNELGVNRHTLYKQRQRQKVKQRLEAGRRQMHTVNRDDEAASEEATKTEGRA